MDPIDKQNYGEQKTSKNMNLGSVCALITLHAEINTNKHIQVIKVYKFIQKYNTISQIWPMSTNNLAYNPNTIQSQ